MPRSSPIPTLNAGARSGLARMRRAAAGMPARASQLHGPVRERLELAAPAWRAVRQRLSWVSPLGWGVLVLAAGCWWLGVRFGWVEPLMIAASALVLFGCCVLLALGRTSVRIEAQVDPDRVTVGQPATGRVVVTNVGRAPKLPLVVELPVGVAAARFVLPPMLPGASFEELFVVPTHHRGVIPVGPATTVQGDPLGLVRRTLRWTERTELFVHPRTVALETIGAGLLRDLEGSVTEDQSLSDLAFHALREYQPGDDRRYIHWRSSAKAGKLLVRQFLDTRRSHLTVVVDPDPRSYPSGFEALTGRAGSAGVFDPHPIAPGGAGTGGEGAPGEGAGDGPGDVDPTTGRRVPRTKDGRAFDVDVETGIAVAASLAMRALLDEQDTTVVCGTSIITRSSAQRVLDEFARLRIGPVDLLRTAVDAAEAAPDTSVAVFVTGPHRGFLDLQRAAAQFGPEVRTLVVRVDPADPGGVRRAGGLLVLTLPALTDLRLLLATGVPR